MAVVIEPESAAPSPDNPAIAVGEGALLAGRYRVLHQTATGWLAYDERLTRPVLITLLAGDASPAERVRQASAWPGLLDAVIAGDDAFAVCTT